MDNLNLKALDLEKKWPKLAELQAEIADLEKHRLEAESKVAQLRAGIPDARDKDLSAAAAAIRKGVKSPKTSNEDEIRGRLQVAERNRDVLQRAVENARTDYGVFLQKHRAKLFDDVVEQRAQIAREAATAARKALAAFGQWSDMHYVLKGLEPPVEVADNTGPPQKLTQVFAGAIQTTQRGPDRGTVEQMLAYVASLGAGEQGGENAA